MNRKMIVFKNFVWELSYYVVVMVLGFLAPRLIIKFYSSEVNGLQSTITQVINVVLLLQCGATTASVYSLYKPVAESNFDEISRSLSSSVSYFKKLAIFFYIIFVFVSVITSLVLKTSVDRKLILIAFIFSGLKSYLDLYYCSKFKIIFSANQKKYVLSVGTLIEQIIYYVLLFFSIYKQYSFIFFNLWFLVGCVFKIFFLSFCFKRQYNQKIRIIRDKTLPKLENRNYALANEVSHSFSASSITVLISIMYGLNEASVFSVYYLVSQALSLISSSMYSAFEPSFANLVASSEKRRAVELFQTFQLFYVMFNTFLMICMLFLITPFARLYTANAAEISYNNYLLAVFLSIMYMLSAYRIPYNMLVSTCGYFKETWKQPVLTVIFTFFISLCFGFIRFEFILLGPIIFYFANFLYQHYRLKKLSKEFISDKVFYEFAISMSLLFFTGVIAKKASNYIGSVLDWILAAFGISFFSFFIIAIFVFLFFKDEVFVVKRLLIKKNREGSN